MVAKRWSSRSRGMRYVNGDGGKVRASRADVPVDATHLECSRCHAGVRQRSDGTLFAHAIGGRAKRTIDSTPCLGSGEFPVGYEAVA